MELELVMERWEKELALVGIADRNCLAVAGIVGKSWSYLVMALELELELVLVLAAVADQMADMDRMMMGRMRLVGIDLVKADLCLCL